MRVHGVLERDDELLIGGVVGARRAGRRHHARAQLANHAFGNIRVLAGLRNVERGERQAAGAILVAIVVATNAVALDQTVVILRLRAACYGGFARALRWGLVRSNRFCNSGTRRGSRRRLRRGLLCPDHADESQARNRGAEGNGTDAFHSKVPTRSSSDDTFSVPSVPSVA